MTKNDKSPYLCGFFCPVIPLFLFLLKLSFLCQFVLFLTVHFFCKTSTHLTDTLVPPVTFLGYVAAGIPDSSCECGFSLHHCFPPWTLLEGEPPYIKSSKRTASSRGFFNFFNFLFKSGLTVTVNCCCWTQFQCTRIQFIKCIYFAVFEQLVFISSVHFPWWEKYNCFVGQINDDDDDDKTLCLVWVARTGLPIRIQVFIWGIANSCDTGPFKSMKIIDFLVERVELCLKKVLPDPFCLQIPRLGWHHQNWATVNLSNWVGWSFSTFCFSFGYKVYFSPQICW